MAKKQTTKAKSKQTKADERGSGSLVPVTERTWPHRLVDHVIADERELGSSRRPPAVTE